MAETLSLQTDEGHVDARNQARVDVSQDGGEEGGVYVHVLFFGI